MADPIDRQDPTLAIQKFIKLGVRRSLIPLLISYLKDRKMRVKYNGTLSKQYSIIGGGPQGTLLGLIEYLVQSNDSADCVDKDERFKYIDDLTILDFLLLTGLLTEFDCFNTVPSDIGIDQMYLPHQNYSTQQYLNEISAWTTNNLMQINVEKTSYMIFTGSKADFGTRLSLDNAKLDWVEEAKVVCVWMQSDMKWTKNTKELTRKAYSRLSMLTKLKQKT
jgi:hypothetical protein